MVIRAHWRPYGPSEMVRDSAGREFEIATFEGGKGPLDPYAGTEPFQMAPYGKKLRASVFLRGGTWQFMVEATAPPSQIEGSLEAIRKEARRRLETGDWEQGRDYQVPVA